MKALKYCSKGQMIFYISFFLLTLNLYAQQIDYAREVIERLCAPDLHGRGYVAEGDKKAAEYIASQFSNFGLSAYQEGYLSTYTVFLANVYNYKNCFINGGF